MAGKGQDEKKKEYKKQVQILNTVALKSQQLLSAPMSSQQVKYEPVNLVAHGFSDSNQPHILKIWDESGKEAVSIGCLGQIVSILLKDNYLFLHQEQRPLHYLRLSQEIQFQILHQNPITLFFGQDTVPPPISGFAIRNTALGSSLPFQIQDVFAFPRLIRDLRKAISRYTKDFRQYYSLVQRKYVTRKVGVYLGRTKNNNGGLHYAIKAKRKDHIEAHGENGWLEIRNEIQNLKKLNHERLVKFHQVCQSDNSIYIVMQFLKGPTLKKYSIQAPKEFSYENIKIIAEGVLRGLAYMHQQGIAHRDIKPENIMLESEHNLQPYIIDFGFSEHIHTREPIHEFCGTPGFLAPECFISIDEREEKINSKSDIFSFGICLFELLFRRAIFKLPLPINQITPKIMLRINKEMQFDFPELIQADIRQTQLVDLIKKMIEKSPEDRISAEEALRHPFFRQIQSEASPASTRCSTRGRKTKQIHKQRRLPDIDQR